MPTATTTMISTQNGSNGQPSNVSLKAATNGSTSSLSSTAATLRSLYPRAATAFLHRNIALTHSLLNSAFSVLYPPSSVVDDGLLDHRKKWDILRITFETTVYASPPESEDPEAFPALLRANQMSSPQSLVTTLHAKSLQLFTPTSHSSKPNAAFLPTQILVTLVLASLKLECPQVGRGIIEDWLARRSASESQEDLDGYTKVLEFYCLQILPRLEEWEYSSDFLQYERELPHDIKNRILASLQHLRQQSLASRRPPSPILTPVITPPSATTSRSVSPSPSLSSESSTSTHTATPQSPRPNSVRRNDKGRAHLHAVMPLTPSSSRSESSQSISSVATSHTITPATVRRSGRKDDERGRRHSQQRTSKGEPSMAPVPRGPRAPSLQPTNSTAARPPSTLAIIRSYLDLSMFQANKSKFLTLLLLFVIFPVLSFLFRLRRKRLAVATAGTGAADQVRRRLRATEGKSTLAKIWEEALRAVMDTVRMGGRGLV